MANREALDRLFADPGLVTEMAQRAVREALREHRLLGHSIVVWQDGKVVHLPPEQIPVDLTEEPAAPVPVEAPAPALKTAARR
jgi:hypothetical protein